MTRELNDLKCLLETLEIEQKDGLKFANINVEGLYNDFIMNDKGFFTMDELDKFKKYLNLTGQETKEELRAIRNTIVKYYSDHVEEYYNKDFATFDKFQDQMSAFTGMIDYLIMGMDESLQEDLNLDQSITKLRNNIFIPNSQKDIIFQYLNNDEAEHYINIINNLDEVIKNSPNLYDTDGKKDKKPILHYFYGSYDAYALELDKQTGEMFGYVSMGYGYELGYFSMDEINTVPEIELDLYFNGNLPKEISKHFNEEFAYIGGGSWEIELPTDIINSICHSGSNDLAVEEAIEDERVRKELDQYTDEEINKIFRASGFDMTEKGINSKTRKEKEQYIVWDAAWNAFDDPNRELDESYKKQPNDFQKALDLIKFGKNKKDKTTYENYLNSFEREGKLNLFTNYCFDKGLKISDIKPETILEDKQKETPYIIYGKTKEQKTFKAMDMNKGVQVNNLIRATLIYEPKDKLEGYVEELKKENPDWEFKFKKA